MKQVRQAQAEWVRSQMDARVTCGEPEAAAGALAAEGGPLDHNTASYTTLPRRSAISRVALSNEVCELLDTVVQVEHSEG